MASKQQGCQFLANRSQKFGQMLDLCNLHSLPSKGPAFTWIRKEMGRSLKGKRLDWVCANLKLTSLFPNHNVRVLARAQSNHHPILFQTNSLQVNMVIAHFATWILGQLDARYQTFIYSSWTNHLRDIHVSLDQTKEYSIQFSKQVFSHLKSRIRRLESILLSIQRQLSVQSSHS